MNHFMNFQGYHPNHIRAVADRFAKKYSGLDFRHVFWIAMKLNIYPDAKPLKTEEYVNMTKTGKINVNNTDYVENGRVSNKGIEAIEKYIITEGYKEQNESEEKSMDSKNIWEQVDLISAIKNDYEKVVAELEKVKTESEEYCKMADKISKENEELKDKLLIYEKENNDLKSEKKELNRMQIKSADFYKDIDVLQTRIGKLNQEINIQVADLNELRKDFSAMQVSMNRMQDNKKKLDTVLSDLVGCSKRLMNMK